MSIPSDLHERVMQLDPDDREMLMHEIRESLKPDAGWWEAWAEEIERRSREIHEGRAELVSWEQVRAEMVRAIEEARRP
jgi:putative addiction module component (TIGR02574 family)